MSKTTHPAASDGTSIPHHLVGRLTLPRQVRDTEAAYINRRRTAAGVEPPATDDDTPPAAPPLVGLSFSGGGIRAATFCLGILQALGRTNVLRLADYLCTVSGGGYLGACFSSLMTCTSPNPVKTKAKAEVEWKRHAGGGVGRGMPLLCTEQIHHLRKHGDFLLLRQGVFSRELLRSIGHLVTGWIGSLGIFVLLLLTLAAAFMAYTSGLASSGLWSSIENEQIPWHELGLAPQWTSLLALLAGLIAGLVGDASIAMLRARPVHAGVEAGETAEDRRERHFIIGFNVWLFGAGVLATLIGAAFVSRTVGNLLWMPSFFAGGFAGATCFYLLSSNLTCWWNKSTRSVYAATVASSLNLLIVSLVLFGLVWAIAWFTRWLESGFAAWLVSVGGAAGIASRVMSSLSMKPALSLKQSSTQQFVRAVLLHIALALSVAIFVMSVFTLSVYLLMELKVTHVYLQLLVAAATLLLFGIWGFAVDFNRIGIHYFYRDRLAETYLLTEARIKGRLEVVRDDSALQLKHLHATEDDGKSLNSLAPYHLILCALNLAGSKDLARKNRKSDHFIFSREYCGSTTTGYIATENYRRGETELATAMTISGAAASSAMGFYTSILQAFATTLFNIRLGYWLVNPRVYDDEPDKVFYSGHATRPEAWSTELPGRKEFGTHVQTWLERCAFWPVYLFRESMLLTTSRSALINLSDGGHTGDNIGLYPLFQRRCKLIIACDGEADPEYGFASFASAIRQIFIDENVKVHVDFDRLRPEKAGEPAKQHYLIGRIEYPPSTRFTIHEKEHESHEKLIEQLDCQKLDLIRHEFEASQVPLSDEATVKVEKAGEEWTIDDTEGQFRLSRKKGHLQVTDEKDPDSEASIGWLIYLKSSLLKKHEPAAVISYAVKEPFFPHQTTGDQLFDDDQFEAYRMLGGHIAETMLSDARIASESAGGRATATDLMNWCARQWRPSPAQLLAAFQDSQGNVVETAKRLGCPEATVAKMLAEATKSCGS